MKCKTCREHENFHVPRKQLTSHANFWQGAWKFPCTLQRNIYLGKVHGNFHVPCNETHFKVHGNFHVPCNETYGKVHGNFHAPCDETYGKVRGNVHVPCDKTYGKVHGNSKYLAMKHMARYMEISMYLAMKHNARYMEIPMYQLPYVSLQGTLKFPCTCKQNIWRNIACHMFRCWVPCQWYCEKVSLLPKET